MNSLLTKNEAKAKFPALYALLKSWGCLDRLSEQGDVFTVSAEKLVDNEKKAVGIAVVKP